LAAERFDQVADCSRKCLPEQQRTMLRRSMINRKKAIRENEQRCT